MGTCKELAKLLLEMEERLIKKMDSQNVDISELSIKLTNIQSSNADLKKKHDELDAKVSQAALKIIDAELYSRKWSLVLYGLPGHESESATRVEIFKICDKMNLSHPILAACHRLGKTDGAAVIIKFVDLSDRDNWIKNSRKLKDYDYNGKKLKLSISPNLPPVLNALKKSVFEKRAANPGSRIQYCPTYPYVYGVKAGNNEKIFSDISKKQLVETLYNV